MNVQDTHSPGGLLSTLGALIRGVVKGALVIAGFVLMLGVMLAGLTLGLAVLLWARLTGRRPRVAFATRWPGGRMNNPFRANGKPPAGAGARSGEVVDVEVREVPVSASEEPERELRGPEGPLR